MILVIFHVVSPKNAPNPLPAKFREIGPMTAKTKEKLLMANPRKGTNQVAVGSYNERLVLSLIRQHGSLTKAEVTRATGLSANAISVIVRALEAQELLLRGEPIRGRIGQPSIPLRINPEARHYVTLKIGRRSLELAIVNFAGKVIGSRFLPHPFPTPTATIDFVTSELPGLLNSANKNQNAITAMAVAMPFQLWSWSEDFDAPRDALAEWQGFNVADALGQVVPWAVTVENDATAACRAELMLGGHPNRQDWIYFYVGTFIGGGVVLNGNVFLGRRGNAGGFGPMRVPEQSGGNRLVDHASLVVLERAIADQGAAPTSLYSDLSDWSVFEPLVEDWIKRAGRNLAHAIVSTLAVIDFEAAVIDGMMPADIRARLVEEVITQLEQTDLQGVHIPEIEAGTLGPLARITGAAAGLITADFTDEPPIAF